MVRDVFRLAKENSPAIIFIDEIDAIATKRFDAQTGADREVQRILLELLNQMDGFDQTTNVILDECHERATDSDLLCLLARRLLRSHPTLRVVLMSATLHSQLFVDYFAASLGRSQVGAPLHVGERRFPLQELFLEEVVQRLGGLPERLRKTAKSLAQQSAASAADGGAVPADQR